jgi:hypothetical protein
MHFQSYKNIYLTFYIFIQSITSLELFDSSYGPLYGILKQYENPDEIIQQILNNNDAFKIQNYHNNFQAAFERRQNDKQDVDPRNIRSFRNL